MSLENLPVGHPDNPTTNQPTPTPTPTPQVETPVVTPVPTPNPTPVEDKNPQDYAGNTVLETSINVFASTTGVTHERFESAIQNALQYGDDNLIDINALTQGLTPDQASQAKALAQAAYQEARTEITRSVESAYQLAGGEAQWNEAAQSFNTNAPPHLKTAVKALLDVGDIGGASQLVLDTVKQYGLVNHGTPPLQGGNGSAQRGLSQSEFNLQIRELERTAGNRSFEQGEYKHKLDALMASRNLGRSQGL